MTVRICQHCHEKKANRPRKLCHRCYYEPGIKAQYPPDPTYSQKCLAGEPTMAELDAMEAEQRKNLPTWWHDHEE